MKVVERCSCGAALMVAFDEGNDEWRGQEEAKRAAKMVSTWRARHARCLEKQREVPHPKDG